MAMARKSRFLRTILLFITICSLSSSTYAKYGGGTGEPNDPYLIYTAEHLNAIGAEPNDWDNHFKLMEDIDLSVFDGKEGRPAFNIIGTDWENQFTGVFDGNGHTISNLTIIGVNYLGMFGQLGSGAEVMNLGVMEVDITGSINYVGGLIGYNSGNVSRCYSTGVVRSIGNTGGLVGLNNDGHVLNCYSMCTVSGNLGVGGLVGRNDGAVTQCKSTGAVIGKRDVGGLVGGNSSQGETLQCYSSSMVSGENHIGGLVGSNWGIVAGCYSSGTVSGEDHVGGLVGSGDPGCVKNGVWDMETSGHTFSAGGVGLTKTEMMDPEMLGLNGLWGDSNWVLNNGRDYPRLVWEGTAGQKISEPVVDWLNGLGTPEDPFQIEKADQLLLLHKSSILWDKHFVLNADIDMEPNLPGRGIFEQAVIPVFAGSFVGNGHVIFNLQIEGEDYLGLFGKIISGSVVRDLGLKNISVYSIGSNVGGLIGDNSGGHVLNSYSTGSVRGDRFVGGLVGRNSWEADMIWCYSNTTVCGESSIGGLVGENYGDLTHCYSTSPVCGSGWGVGGLVGSGDNEDVTNCFWDIQTSGQITSVGGMGKTTAEMQMAETFLEAGWDFVGEAENGTEDIWLIIEGQDYPRLKGLPEGPRLWPYSAFCPNPQNGAIDVIQSPVLYWAPANPTMQHDIYLGDDKQAVANATTLSLGTYRGRQTGDVTSYDPGILEWGKTYYWRIDEYYTDAIISRGHVWSFTAANFIVVDDFESYNDLDPGEPESRRIFDIWEDGFFNPEINGSIVGPLHWHDWQMIVHSGMQSMPFNYDNSGPANYSEATKTLTDLRDWTIEGVGVLSLWFKGYSVNAPEPMYVALNCIMHVDLNRCFVVYHDNPDAAQIEEWTEWTINLQKFADQGLNLANVSTITIGFGDKNNPQTDGSGKLWFDDIRLYRPDTQEPEP